jgi:hypothetical protein
LLLEQNIVITLIWKPKFFAEFCTLVFPRKHYDQTDFQIKILSWAIWLFSYLIF